GSAGESQLRFAVAHQPHLEADDLIVVLLFECEDVAGELYVEDRGWRAGMVHLFRLLQIAVLVHMNAAGFGLAGKWRAGLQADGTDHQVLPSGFPRAGESGACAGVLSRQSETAEQEESGELSVHACAIRHFGCRAGQQATERVSEKDLCAPITDETG